MNTHSFRTFEKSNRAVSIPHITVILKLACQVQVSSKVNLLHETLMKDHGFEGCWEENDGGAARQRKVNLASSQECIYLTDVQSELPL